MTLARFSISLDEDLLRRFDDAWGEEGCPTRSKAVSDLIRASLVQTEWQDDAEVAGAVVLVYDHHKRDLLRKLTDIQHDHHGVILSSQHVHLDHDNCLEIVALRGPPAEIARLIRRIKAVKSLKHVSVAAGTTGARLP